jgi:hypothetical protein
MSVARTSLLAGCVRSALLSGTDDGIDVSSIVLQTLCGTPARLLGFFLGLDLRRLTAHLSSTRQGPVHFTHGEVAVLTSTAKLGIGKKLVTLQNEKFKTTTKAQQWQW